MDASNLQKDRRIIIIPNRVRWLERVSVSSVVIRKNLVYLFYTGQDSAGIFRIGLAISGDGVHFSNVNQPVLFPAEDFMKMYERKGISNPHIVENENGTFFLNYIAHDNNALRLCFASSTDLLNWTKLGPAFSGSYFDKTTSSGSVVARQENDRIIAEKINNKYWMYFGSDTLFAATSEDLLHWSPVEHDGEKKILPIADIRHLTGGPFALKTPEGILLPFNRDGLASQMLFDSEDPKKVIDQLETPFSIVGDPDAKQLAAVMAFKNSWFLYYPLADSKIGIATAQP
jgi:beta-1,2-mannosidase